MAQRYYVRLTPENVERLTGSPVENFSNLKALEISDLVINDNGEVIKSREFSTTELNTFGFVKMKDERPKNNRTRVDTLEINDD